MEFVGQLYDVGSASTPFASIGIGANFWGVSSTGSGATTAQIGANNLTGYSSYALAFTNNDDDTWWVNPFLCTGWTDGPWNETPNYYENGWAELLPGQSTVLSVDLTSAANLNHVTNIGFVVGGNMDQAGPSNPSNPDTFKIEVNTVPEPSSMILLGLGLMGVAGRVRRKRFKA